MLLLRVLLLRMLSKLVELSTHCFRCWRLRWMTKGCWRPSARCSWSYRSTVGRTCHSTGTWWSPLLSRYRSGHWCSSGMLRTHATSKLRLISRTSRINWRSGMSAAWPHQSLTDHCSKSCRPRSRWSGHPRPHFFAGCHSCWPNNPSSDLFT